MEETYLVVVKVLDAIVVDVTSMVVVGVIVVVVVLCVSMQAHAAEKIEL